MTQIIFSDSFNTEGSTGFGFTDFDNWTVTSGNVDLLPSSPWSSSLSSVDLNGYVPGKIVSKNISLTPGTYDFSYQYSIYSGISGERSAKVSIFNAEGYQYYQNNIVLAQTNNFETINSTIIISSTEQIQISNFL